jgi:putative hydrolase of the HAD superfamily
LGIISNTGKLSRSDILRPLPSEFERGLFDQDLVIFSSEVGVAKPDRGIFLLAIERAQIAPPECLFCTEEEAHISAARDVGIQTMKVREPPSSDIGELVDRLIARGMLRA